jgi:hypothetical protein
VICLLAGEVVTVIAGSKLAAMVFGPFIVTWIGLLVLLTDPVHEEKAKPPPGLAVRLGAAPLFCQHPAVQSGETVPEEGGLTEVVSRYWVVK